MYPRLDSVKRVDKPFRYFLSHEQLPMESTRWLDWLENEAPWRYESTDFYEQYEFDMLHSEVAPCVQHFVDNEKLIFLRDRMSDIFDIRLSERVDVTAHKLVQGQTIRIHNDHIPGAEVCRLLIQLNRSWREEHGGWLMFFSNSTSDTVHEVVAPVSGSIQAFVISKRSYHAVSTVHEEQRFTIVYSFHSKS